MPDPKLDLAEAEVLLGIIWPDRATAAEQAKWIEQLGWRVIVYPPPAGRAADSTYVYALVTYPHSPTSPGAIRYRHDEVATEPGA